VIAAAAVGFPGLVVWDARATLVDLTIAGPIGLVVVLSSVAQLAIYGRLLIVGFSKPSEAVAGGLTERPTWPDAVAPRNIVGLSRAERVFERGGHAIGVALDVCGDPAAIGANRALLAGAIAVLVAALACRCRPAGSGSSRRHRPCRCWRPGPGRGSRGRRRRSHRARRCPAESPGVRVGAG
jgi:hypothetical protein